jgi:hypothetical protein
VVFTFRTEGSLHSAGGEEAAKVLLAHPVAGDLERPRKQNRDLSR